MLLATPALDLASKLCTVGEQGLVGIAVHPDFAANNYVYLYYIFNTFNNSCPESTVDGPVGRLSRFVLPATNVIDPASETVLFEATPGAKASVGPRIWGGWRGSSSASRTVAEFPPATRSRGRAPPAAT